MVSAVLLRMLFVLDGSVGGFCECVRIPSRHFYLALTTDCTKLHIVYRELIEPKTTKWLMDFLDLGHVEYVCYAI